jgi:membrane protease YdiL (CAAX protease family)
MAPDGPSRRTDAPARAPLVFFGLLYLGTVPFWWGSAHVPPSRLPDALPWTDIGATFVPLLAASVLVGRHDGWPGVRQLWRRAVDLGRVRDRRWYAPMLLLLPGLYGLTYAVMRAIALPVPSAWSPSPWTPVVFLAFWAAAAGEELGYTGYALDPLQHRYGALGAAIRIGVPWALWHVPSMLALGQAWPLLGWGLLATVAYRVLYVWLYNNTNRSVGAVILFHAIGNTGRTAFPGGRAHFELAHAAIGYGLVTLTAVSVVLLWGPRTLAQWRAGAGPAVAV